MFLSRVAVTLVALSLGSVDASRCQPDPRSTSVTATSDSAAAASTGTSSAGDVSTTLSTTDGSSTTVDTSSAALTTSGDVSTTTTSVEISSTKATTTSGPDTATTLTTVVETSTSEALSSTTLITVTGTSTSESPSSTTDTSTAEDSTTAPTTTTEGPAAPTNHVKNYSFEDKDEQGNYVDSPWVVDGANAAISHDGTVSKTGQSAALFKTTDNTSRPKVRQLVGNLVAGEYYNIFWSWALIDGTPPPNYDCMYTVNILGTPYTNQDYLRETHPKGRYSEYSNSF